MAAEPRTTDVSSDPADTLTFMKASPRQRHNGTSGAPHTRSMSHAHASRVGRGLFAVAGSVTILTGCATATTPYNARLTTTTQAPNRDAANAGANSAAPQPISAPPSPASTSGLLDGIPQVPARKGHGDYRRAAFGETWTDDQDAPGGHNGCDTRNDILGRDLVDKVYTSISRCPNAVATGILHDPYTGTDIAFTRGNQVGAAVQIDHIVPLAYAWDMGARDWTSEMRTRFANDPANLLAVDGKSNQAKSDKEPAKWLPANTAYRCEYVTRFAAVLRTYGLSIDAPSAAVATKVAATCPAA